MRYARALLVLVRLILVVMGSKPITGSNLKWYNMKLKYRIVDCLHTNEYQIEAFSGFWIFGTWRRKTNVFGTEKRAAEYIANYAADILAAHGDVVKEITIK